LSTLQLGKTTSAVDGSIVQILARIAKLAWITVGDGEPTCGYRLHTQFEILKGIPSRIDATSATTKGTADERSVLERTLEPDRLDALQMQCPPPSAPRLNLTLVVGVVLLNHRVPGIVAFLVSLMWQSFGQGLGQQLVISVVGLICVLAFWLVHRLNQQQVKKSLESRRDELEALLSSLNQ
jgi:hypothetical protein